MKDLEKFEPYWITKINDKKVQIGHPQTLSIVADYFKEKYQANIIIPKLLLNDDNQFVVNDDGIWIGTTDFANLIKNFLPLIPKNGEDFRCSFVTGGTHTTPISYIRENGKEAIIYPDTKGKNDFLIEFLRSQSEMPVYYLSQARQYDNFSCYTEAMLFGKEFSGKKPGSEEFLIPNLLEKISKNSKLKEEKEGIYEITQLPSRLLKTSQISRFVNHYKIEGDDLEIGKSKEKQTIEDFYQKHTKKDEDDKHIEDYLTKKGVALANIAKRHFYKKQLEANFGPDWNKELEKNFIDLAIKAQSEDELYEIANHINLENKNSKQSENSASLTISTDEWTKLNSNNPNFRDKNSKLEILQAREEMLKDWLSKVELPGKNANFHKERSGDKKDQALSEAKLQTKDKEDLKLPPIGEKWTDKIASARSTRDNSEKNR